MESKWEFHRGGCNKCPKIPNYTKAVWVMCYRLPIKLNMDGYEIEVGEHVDLCLPCITRFFHIFSGNFKVKLKR